MIQIRDQIQSKGLAASKSCHHCRCPPGRAGLRHWCTNKPSRFLSNQLHSLHILATTDWAQI